MGGRKGKYFVMRVSDKVVGEKPVHILTHRDMPGPKLHSRISTPTGPSGCSRISPTAMKLT